MHCLPHCSTADDELNFLLLRQRAAAYMRAHADHFKPFVLEASCAALCHAVLCCAALRWAGLGWAGLGFGALSFVLF